MNQVEMTVTMKKYYNAKRVPASNAFRLRRNGRIFDLIVTYKSSNAGLVTIERMFIEERVISDDDLDSVKKRVIASMETRPKDIKEIIRWINQQLIGAFLDEHCGSSEETSSAR